ncbi:MAG: hypothetical protein KDC48_13885, partial [Planctomycetes bacterium]|nr:hypothetical protein [Planctomycetota bacterium]
RTYHKTRVRKNVDLQAAAEEIGRMSRQGFLDQGGPVIRLEGIDDEPQTPEVPDQEAGKI